MHHLYGPMDPVLLCHLHPTDPCPTSCRHPVDRPPTPSSPWTTFTAHDGYPGTLHSPYLTTNTPQVSLILTPFPPLQEIPWLPPPLPYPPRGPSPFPLGGGYPLHPFFQPLVCPQPYPADYPLASHHSIPHRPHSCQPCTFTLQCPSFPGGPTWTTFWRGATTIWSRLVPAWRIPTTA